MACFGLGPSSAAGAAAQPCTGAGRHPAASAEQSLSRRSAAAWAPPEAVAAAAAQASAKAPGPGKLCRPCPRAEATSCGLRGAADAPPAPRCTATAPASLAAQAPLLPTPAKRSPLLPPPPLVGGGEATANLHVCWPNAGEGPALSPPMPPAPGTAAEAEVGESVPPLVAGTAECLRGRSFSSSSAEPDADNLAVFAPEAGSSPDPANARAVAAKPTWRPGDPPRPRVCRGLAAPSESLEAEARGFFPWLPRLLLPTPPLLARLERRPVPNSADRRRCSVFAAPAGLISCARRPRLRLRLRLGQEGAAWATVELTRMAAGEMKRCETMHI
mmetsp:Transcript_79791/g.258497  ORF Transcript_79791/g.258497 Transcript_79791/m.258497 type:complete len:330 (+) Transcript_79791:1794-2783(+)